MNWFLKAKHWQIFLLNFGLPILFEFIGIITVFMTREPAFFFILFFLIMISAIGTQIGWFYAVGTALAQRMGENSGMNLRRFKNFVFIPLIYLSLLTIGMSVFGLFMMNHGQPSPFLALVLVIIVPLHFFTVFCIFYSLWFVAKSLKMVEKWNHVTFGDYVGEFFLIWFFFVGVWFIQPRINRLFDPTLPPQIPPQYSQPIPPQYAQQYSAQNPPPPSV